MPCDPTTFVLLPHKCWCLQCGQPYYVETADLDVWEKAQWEQKMSPRKQECRTVSERKLKAGYYRGTLTLDMAGSAVSAFPAATWDVIASFDGLRWWPESHAPEECFGSGN